MSRQNDPFYGNDFSLKMLLINDVNVVINWLLGAANFSPARNDGTPVNRFIVTRSWFDIYTTIGVGKTELFSKEQTEKLGVLGYFLDTGNTKSPLEMLYDISNIMITRPRETSTFKNGMHVYRHYMNFYCSTGLGQNLEDAKNKSAEQMICTLQKLCGFVPEIKLPPTGNHPVNDRNDHQMCLHLPLDDQYKIKMIRYFMERSGHVPHAVQLNEIASMLKVVVKYSDSGDEDNFAVACEFGPHIEVGVGSSKMVSVFRSRTAMLNKLRLVCGYEQYSRTFVPQDCLDSAEDENRGKERGYGVSVPSFPTKYQTDEPGMAGMDEPVESRDTAMWNRTAGTTPTSFANDQEPTEVNMRDGIMVSGTFKPIPGWRSVRCVARFGNIEESSDDSDYEDIEDTD